MYAHLELRIIGNLDMRVECIHVEQDDHRARRYTGANRGYHRGLHTLRTHIEATSTKNEESGSLLLVQPLLLAWNDSSRAKPTTCHF